MLTLFQIVGFSKKENIKRIAEFVNTKLNLL